MKTSLLLQTVWSSSDIRLRGKYKVESVSSDFHYKVPVSRQRKNIDYIGRSFYLVYPGKYDLITSVWSTLLSSKLTPINGLLITLFLGVLYIYIYFFFFRWHYSPLWALACRTVSFQFFPICHQLSPSSHSHHLKISFYFLCPSFPGSSPSSRPFQFLSEDFFGHPILLHSL